MESFGERMRHTAVNFGEGTADRASPRERPQSAPHPTSPAANRGPPLLQSSSTAAAATLSAQVCAAPHVSVIASAGSGTRAAASPAPRASAASLSTPSRGPLSSALKIGRRLHVTISSRLADTLYVTPGRNDLQVLEESQTQSLIVYPVNFLQTAGSMLSTTLPKSCSRMEGMFIRGWFRTAGLQLVLVLSSANSMRMTDIECMAGVPPLAQPLLQQQVIMVGLPQLGSVQPDAQLPPQYQPLQVAVQQQQQPAAARQLLAVTASALVPLPEAYEDDTKEEQLHKLHFAVAQVLGIIKRPLSFDSSVRARLRKWSDGDVKTFQSTTYTYLRKSYMGRNVPSMIQVMSDIENGTV